MKKTDIKKAFDVFYKAMTKDWCPNSIKGFKGIYFETFSSGFEAGYLKAESDMRAKAEPLMKRFGI